MIEIYTNACFCKCFSLHKTNAMVKLALNTSTPFKIWQIIHISYLLRWSLLHIHETPYSKTAISGQFAKYLWTHASQRCLIFRRSTIGYTSFWKNLPIKLNDIIFTLKKVLQDLKIANLYINFKIHISVF